MSKINNPDSTTDKSSNMSFDPRKPEAFEFDELDDNQGITGAFASGEFDIPEFDGSVDYNARQTQNDVEEVSDTGLAMQMLGMWGDNEEKGEGEGDPLALLAEKLKEEFRAQGVKEEELDEKVWQEIFARETAKGKEDAEKKRGEVLESAKNGTLKKVEEADWGVFKSFQEIYVRGLMWVELEDHDGKSIFNYLDAQKRVAYPQKWFRKVGPFKIRNFTGVEIMMLDGLDEPVSLVEGVDGRHWFFTPLGQLFKAIPEDIHVYMKSDEEIKAESEPKPEGDDEKWHGLQIETYREEVVQREVEVEKKETPHQYIDSFLSQMSAYANRLDKNQQDVISKLENKIVEFQDKLSDQVKWEDALEELSRIIQQTSLNVGIKTFFDASLWRKAHRLDLESNIMEKLLPFTADQTREITQTKDPAKPYMDPNKWFNEIQYENGVVVGMGDVENKTAKYFVIHNRAILYIDEPFDRFDRFIGNLALVQRGSGFNFVKKETGHLLRENAWFSKAYPAKAGMYRVRTGSKYSFINSVTGERIGGEGYDDAEDFKENGKARVRVGNDEFWINKNGDMNPVSKFFQKILGPFKSREPEPEFELDSNRFNVPTDRALDVRKNHIKYRVHDFFRSLLDKYPDEGDRLIEVFGALRGVVNQEVKKGINPENIRSLSGKLFSLTSESGLLVGARQEIIDFILGLKKEQVYWGEISEMPVTFLMTFKSLILRHQDEEDKLINLFIEMESHINQNRSEARNNFSKILLNFGRWIDDRGLEGSIIKEEILEVFKNMKNSKDVYL